MPIGGGGVSGSSVGIRSIGDLIKSSLRIVGAIAKQETPASDEMNDALLALNLMLNQWSIRNLMVRANIQEGFDLTAGTRTYTIGVGGDFDTSKPFKITSAFLRDSDSIDTPVSVVEKTDYDAYEDKMIAAGRPDVIAYDPGETQQVTQTGTIYVYAIPDSSSTYTLYITSEKGLTEVSNWTDPVTFDRSYGEAIKYNLAIRLWREYHQSGISIPDDIILLARESISAIQTLNAKQITSELDIPSSVGGGYNIYTGDSN